MRDVSKFKDAVKDGEPVCCCVCDADTGERLLHVAAKNEAVTFMDEMVNGTTKCNDVFDNFNNTVFHTTSANCDTSMNANLLYTSRRGVNLTNADGLNPLCLAAVTDDPKCGGIVKQLVDIGKADICSPCNAAGDIPYEVAKNKIVKDVIEQKGGKRLAEDGTCLDE